MESSTAHNSASALPALIPAAGQSRLAEVTRAESTPRSRLAAWLSSLSANTCRAYTADLDRLAEFMGADGAGHAIEVLCTIPRRNALETLERWRDDMIARGLSSAAVNRPLAAVNSALRHLAKADFGPGRLDVSPVRAERRHNNAGPDHDAVLAVFQKLRRATDPTSRRDLAILSLAAQRGLRRAEICGLTLADLRPDACEISVKRKGKREKVSVKIAPATAAAISAWLDARASIVQPNVDAVFVSICRRRDQTGFAIGGSAVHGIVKRLGGNEAGRQWRPHGLRHAAISVGLRKLGNLEAVKNFAGHASVSTTSGYVDNGAELAAEVVAALASAY